MLSFAGSTRGTSSIAAADSGTAASVTGTVDEAVMKIIPLPAGRISAKTLMLVVSCSLANTVATTRTFRVRISTVAPVDGSGTSGLAGTVIGQWVQAVSQTSLSIELAIRDRLGASQRSVPIGQQSATSAANAWAAASATSADREIVITCQLAASAGGETGVVEFYTAELVP
jgi:hypothetical protein